MVGILREKFAHLGLTYSIGGQISFDVFPKVVALASRCQLPINDVSLMSASHLGALLQMGQEIQYVRACSSGHHHADSYMHTCGCGHFKLDATLCRAGTRHTACSLSRRSSMRFTSLATRPSRHALSGLPSPVAAAQTAGNSMLSGMLLSVARCALPQALQVDTLETPACC